MFLCLVKKNEGWGWDDLFVSNCFIGSVQFYWFASLFKVLKYLVKVIFTLY